MREIGGYIELDMYHLPMLHEGFVALNCGRNCLAYLIKSRSIKRIKIPYYICSSIPDVCDREGVEKKYYHVDINFRPIDVCLDEDEWLYLVNFYGQLNNDDIFEYVNKYKRVIVDNANAYFQEPVDGVDTLYTCRKWFGVSDGAFLYTSSEINEDLEQDESFQRMDYLLGRFERTASEFYIKYSANNIFFANEPIKRMSKLTTNLLHGIDYKVVHEQRKRNYEYLHKKLGEKNQLQLNNALFMYPFMVDNGSIMRKRLQEKKIYIPTLWPMVIKHSSPQSIEYKMANNILPLPIDQRYNINDMKYIVREVLRCIN